ncbi:PH domain-containing protein [Corynebacterium kozikiae]|uniref:PH domain-containing protein n=1 Tax=Corynebacterium kozikiae TaxID=2968469 RepID=UPI00211C8A33|nr:PH domain-containing protein [Corynebacterium sp. 76QC2CO]MCQ9343171.1 PH domain-containing protein [Corynebacterium sp. 76QC2CO]
MNRVHRLTPLLQFWQGFIAIVIATVVQIDFDLIREHPLVLAWTLGGFVAACLIIWAVSGIWWRATTYDIGDEIVLRQGVFNKKRTSARREKIQAVDVVEPFLPRIFGLAELRVETAGGAGSTLTISYLRKHEAERIRAELTGVHSDRQHELPILRSLTAIALSQGWGVALMIAGAILNPALLLPAALGIVPAVWSALDRAWRFSIQIDDTIRITYGLANRRRQSIPIDRIHAIQLEQPPLWRIFNWWRVRATAIGYEDASTILPVCTYDEASALARRLGAPLPVDSTNPAYRTPERGKWVSPLAYRRQAVEVGEYITIFSGRLMRRSATVKTKHIQELSLTEGPIQRRLHLRNLRLDLVPGPIKMTARDLDADDAVALLSALRRRDVELIHQETQADATPHTSQQPPRWTDSSNDDPQASGSEQLQ